MKLFIPGPVNVDDKTLLAAGHEMIGHRGEGFKKLHTGCVERLKKLLRTDNHVFVMTCSATGAMEAAVRNCVGAKRVLALANGDFARRFHEIAVACGKDSKIIDFGDGIAYDLGIVEKELACGGYDAVLMVVNDTATGIENPLAGMRKVVDRHPGVLLVADAVTALFGCPLDVNLADVVVTGSQKALGLPPGIAISVVSERALERSREVADKGYYFDYVKTFEQYNKGFTLTTPAVSLFFALDYRLSVLSDVGMDEYVSGHRARALLVRKFFEEKGFSLFVREGWSSTVTVISNNQGIDVVGLIDALKKKGFLIADGYGGLKGKTFRVGHMGVSMKDTTDLLKEIDGII